MNDPSQYQSNDNDEPQQHPCFICWQETKQVEKCHVGDVFYFVMWEPARERLERNQICRRALCDCCVERVFGPMNSPDALDAIGKLFIAN
jgi:hypothetical protein